MQLDKLRKGVVFHDVGLNLRGNGRVETACIAAKLMTRVMRVLRTVRYSSLFLLLILLAMIMAC